MTEVKIPQSVEEFEADRKAMGQKVCPNCTRVGLIWKIDLSKEETGNTYATCKQCWWQDKNVVRVA